MPYADIRGARLHYEDIGDGAPVLLLPGALGTGRSDFAPQLEGLPRRGLRVIAPDPRGYGRSRPPERRFPPDFYQQDALDAAALMEALGCAAYAVGGWSDGAIGGLLLALACPQRVTRLAVWGGNAYVTPGGHRPVRDHALGVGLAAARSRRPCWRCTATASRRCGRAGATRSGGSWRRAATCAASASATSPAPPSCCTAARIPLVPLSHAEFLHQGIAGARLHVFPEGRHDIHVFHAEAFNDLLAAFLLA